MEASARPRLHPLLTAAAISVTVFSAVGIGALTGLLPSTRGFSPEPAAVSAALPVPQPALPAAAPAPVTSMPAAPASTPSAPLAKPARKHVVAHAAPQPPAAPTAYGPEAPQLAQAAVPPPPPAPLETSRPVVQGSLSVVESVKEVTQPGETTGLGPVAGGVAGAIVGNQFGHGSGRSIMTLLGAAGGAFAGKEIEKQARGTKRWDITVRLEDGSYRTVPSTVEPFWHAGDRVRLVDGRLQPA